MWSDDVSCRVCSLPDRKQLGNHYGAVTCLACRAFFRRAKNRKRTLRCSANRDCSLGLSTEKLCRHCRYEKCISVGMNPELVLNEEQKNKRFRSSYGLPCRHISSEQQRAGPHSPERIGEEQLRPPVSETLATSSQSSPPLTFFRVSVIQRNNVTPEPATALSLPDSSLLLQKEMDLVWHYLHKKFRRNKEILGKLDSRELIRFDKDEVPSEYRDSDNLYSEMLLQRRVVDINLVVDQWRLTFEECWRGVNFGETIISSYEDFCLNKTDFQPAFWQVVNHNLRMRCLIFLTSLDMFQDMSVPVIFRLLKGNLHTASMLAYIYTMNQPSAELELSFIMGSRDYDQWSCRNKTLISGVPLSQMIPFFPLSDDDRFGFHRKLFENCLPIFGDKTVIILMMLVTILKDESTDKANKMVQDTLERYLHVNYGTGDKFQMRNIKTCLEVLPQISETFDKMIK